MKTLLVLAGAFLASLSINAEMAQDIDVAKGENGTKNQPSPLTVHISELRHCEDESVQEALRLLDAYQYSYLEVLEAEEYFLRTKLQEEDITIEEKKSLSRRLKRNIQLQRELKRERKDAGFAE